MKTNNQIYSDIVFDKIQTLVNDKGEESKSIKKYKSLNKRAGGILRTVGLISFLTFLASKAKKDSEIHHQYLLDHLMEELAKLKIILAKNQKDFLDKICKQELPDYMRTTIAILKLLQWHKRISDILISGTVEED